MIKSNTLVLVLILAVTAGHVFALDLAKWEYQARLSIQDGTEKYCRLTLTPEIYDAARADLADIRLIDPDGEQIPYVLARAEDWTRKVKYEPAIINRSTNPYGASMATLDFKRQTIKNSIEVETSGDNFRRTVRIEGSNDNVEFFTLVKQAYVFAVNRSTRFCEVDLPTNDYRYLRVTVEPMPTEERDVLIKELRAFRVETKLAKRQSVKMILAEHREDEKRNLSIYVYDLVNKRLPISEIKLDITNGSFYRFVSVEGRDASTRRVRIDSEDNRERFREVEVPWQSITSDTVYRYAGANDRKRENLVLKFPSGRRAHRYLKITIKNYDDKPISVTSASAKMIADQLVLEPRDNSTATLYVGSQSAHKPIYDLTHRLTRPLQVKTRMVQLGSIADNPLFGQAGKKKLAWTEKHKVLLLIILGITVLVLGAFILKSFKSIQSQRVQD